MAKLNAEQRRRLQEQTFADRFVGAEPWLELATKGPTMLAWVPFGMREWVTIHGLSTEGVQDFQVQAPGIYRLRPDYERLRLKGQWLTLDGKALIDSRLQELYQRLAATRDPTSLRPLKVEQWFLEQADRNPGSRQPWSRLLSIADIARPAFRLAR